MDGRVLAPLLLKEIHYRLLASPLGRGLARLLRHDSHESAIARALARLRRDFRAPMVVEELARGVGMSVSSFHEHFKRVTASSPLQYQKGLRLLEARRLLVAGTATVTSAAFDVVTRAQRSSAASTRESSGLAPSKDVERARPVARGDGFWASAGCSRARDATQGGSGGAVTLTS